MDKKTGMADISIVSGSLISNTFNDIYFSPQNAIDESNYNFIKGNNLIERFRLPYPKTFIIAETGFGTGLNFILVASLWQKNNTINKSLHYISVEKYPINKTTLEGIFKQQNWKSNIAQKLLERYNPNCQKNQEIEIENNIKLTIYYDDALNAFKNNHFIADAWFLDGFAPSKNQDMWSTPLFKNIAKNSKKGTTFATFTAASQVRKSLISAGFSVTKEKGFANKRERMLGVLL